jgi:hypothetical protein
MKIKVAGMRQFFSLLLLFPVFIAAAPAAGRAKEFLTDKEIDQIRENQDIDARVKIYMEAAALRLKTAEERLNGKESEPGDPLEFFTPEDMLDAYYRILKSVMANIDDAANPDKASSLRDRALADDCGYNCGSNRKQVTKSDMLRKALKNLKSETEKNAAQLEVLKKIAEQKNKEELWNLVNNAIEINTGAREGAEYGLSKQPSQPSPPQKKK